MLHLFIPSSSRPLAPADLLLLSAWFCLFQNIIGLEWYSLSPVQDCLLSLGNMHWSFLHVFPLLKNIPLWGLWMYHSLFIRSPAEGHLGCFQILMIMNKTEHPCSGRNMIVGLCGKSIIWFCKEIAKLSSKAATPFAFPQVVNETFLLLILFFRYKANKGFLWNLKILRIYLLIYANGIVIKNLSPHSQFLLWSDSTGRATLHLCPLQAFVPVVNIHRLKNY